MKPKPKIQVWTRGRKISVLMPRELFEQLRVFAKLTRAHLRKRARTQRR
jgi:hypothetical protein